MKTNLLTLALLVVLGTACQKDDPADPTATDPQPIVTTTPGNSGGTPGNTGDLRVTSNVPYGASETQAGLNKALLMDIYEPDGTAVNRTLVVLAHGGGFYTGDKLDMSELAADLAAQGYVVASINYRLLDVDGTPERITLAVAEATMDMKAAVRFFTKDAANDNLYKINPNSIFVGGYSAGGFMALHYAYMTTDKEVEQAGGADLLAQVGLQGGMDGNSGNAGFPSRVKGVINIAGALARADFVDAGEPALFSIHGTEDEVVPFTSGISYESGVFTEGSQLIHQQANKVGIRNTLSTVPGGDHGSPFDCDECFQEMLQFLAAESD